jgi:4-amino-4-deoxy-L-arabinose transferase-like glycosyltransferase
VKRREGLFVLLLCVVTYGAGLGDVAFYTRGEPREGLVVREMLRSGAWLVPARPEGEIARKPPLYYWLAAPVLAARGDAPELALRIPSALTATAAVVGMWAAVGTIATPTAALASALVLATAFEWTRAAVSARVDMTLAAALTLVFGAWLLVVAGRDRRWIWVATAGAALATLAKGPVGLVLPALAASAFAGWRRDRTILARLGVVQVTAVAALVAGAWYALAFATQGRAFFDVVVKENLLRFIDTDDARTGHAHGLLYLPIVGLVGLLPWVPLLPLATPARRDEPATFAAIWALVVLAFFSLANAKRSVYLLPAFPAFAFLVGTSTAAGRGARAHHLAMLYLPALVAVGAVALAFGLGVDPGVVLHRWLRGDDAYAAKAIAAAAHSAQSLVVTIALATIAAAVAVEQARRADAWPRVVAIVAAAMVAWTVLFDVAVHPAIARTRSLRDFMEHVDRLTPRDASLAASFPTDPGLRFYAPRPLVRLTDASDEQRQALLWEDEWRRLRDDAGEPLRTLGVSEARQARHGPLVLVVVPRGTLRRVAPPSDGPPAPGLRTDSRYR